MKNIYLIMSVFLFLSMLLIPLIALSETTPDDDDIGMPDSSDIGPVEKVDEFIVFNHKTEKTQKISADDYIWGVVAAEISPEYHEEAIKAQAIAAYTFACRRRQSRLGNSEQKFDVTTDSTLDQGFISKEDAAAKWGDKAREYTEKLKSAIDTVKGYVITDDNKPILAAYHAVSGGKTESSKNVWGSDFSYLQPVESVGDLLSPGYLSEAKFTVDEFKTKLGEQEVKLEGEASGWFKEPARSQSGTVLKISLGNKEFTGKNIRGIFGLRSANFDVAYKDDVFTFTVRGYGHGVGMSQYGANYMAVQGSTFLEILSWYYTGCQLSRPD